jgi:hypothetical protein
MIRDKNPALFYGFAPDYVAATDWIQMELEIAQFHLSNITSGMTPLCTLVLVMVYLQRKKEEL